MPQLLSIEFANQLIAGLRARWVVHADFTSRGTVIEQPRLMHYANKSGNAEQISIGIPGISGGDKVQEAPPRWENSAPLIVSVIVDIPMPKTDPSGDATAAVLAALNPIATITQKRIEIDLRLMRSPDPPDALSCQFKDWAFEDYSVGVDIVGNRLRAAGVFTYTVTFEVPEYFDASELDDLEGIDVDYNLWEGVGSPILLAEPPHAQDDETL